MHPSLSPVIPAGECRCWRGASDTPTPTGIARYEVGSGSLGEPLPELGPGLVKEPKTQAGSEVVEQVIDDFEVGIDVQVGPRPRPTGRRCR